jgi:prepilin-type N-terminal cleavage/methylation domain-containing protein
MMNSNTAHSRTAAAGRTRNHGTVRRRAARGFTLVETMAVTAIVSVLGAVASYGLSAHRGDQNVAAFARAVHFLMLRARADATADQYQRQIACTQSRCTYLVATTRGMGTPSGTPATSWQSAGTAVEGASSAYVWGYLPVAQVTTVPPGPGPISGTQTITFFPDGTATGATYLFGDANGGNNYKAYVYVGTGMSRLVNNW